MQSSGASCLEGRLDFVSNRESLWLETLCSLQHRKVNEQQDSPNLEEENETKVEAPLASKLRNNFIS